MKKLLCSRILPIVILSCALLAALSGCGEQRVSLSKNMLVGNETDVTVTSITLDVEDGSLNSPIELIDSPLAPGEARQVSFAVPEKQAQNGKWVVKGVTEDGEDASSSFAIGSFNPHGDGSDKTCFGVWKNDDTGKYSVKVYFNNSEADEDMYASVGES